jgi:hypothetical protein
MTCHVLRRFEMLPAHRDSSAAPMLDIERFIV